MSDCFASQIRQECKHYDLLSKHDKDFSKAQCTSHCKYLVEEGSESTPAKLARKNYLHHCGRYWKEYIRKSVCGLKQSSNCHSITLPKLMQQSCGKFVNQTVWLASEQRIRQYYNACHMCVQHRLSPSTPPKVCVMCLVCCHVSA